MLDDGVKDKGVEETVKTLDIAEIVARSLPDKPALSKVEGASAAAVAAPAEKPAEAAPQA